jgi:hypothetical protein
MSGTDRNGSPLGSARTLKESIVTSSTHHGSRARSRSATNGLMIAEVLKKSRLRRKPSDRPLSGVVRSWQNWPNLRHSLFRDYGPLIELTVQLGLHRLCERLSMQIDVNESA